MKRAHICVVQQIESVLLGASDHLDIYKTWKEINEDLANVSHDEFHFTHINLKSRLLWDGV